MKKSISQQSKEVANNLHLFITNMAYNATTLEEKEVAILQLLSLDISEITHPATL